MPPIFFLFGLASPDLLDDLELRKLENKPPHATIPPQFRRNHGPQCPVNGIPSQRGQDNDADTQD
jgi:hypothetical protein